MIEGEWTATSMHYYRSGEAYELIISNSNYSTEAVTETYTNPELYKKIYFFNNINSNKGDYSIKENKSKKISTSTSYPFRSTYEVLNEMEVIEKGKFELVPNDNGDDHIIVKPYNTSNEPTFSIIELTSNKLIINNKNVKGSDNTVFNTINGNGNAELILNK